MLNIQIAVNIIEQEIKSLKIPDTPENLYEPIKYILSCGGKRMRPALTLISCNIFDVDYHKALYPALGIELFHNFTLIHDDLMDNSSLRRNDPTVHVRWNPNTAILAGDAMYIIASKMVCKVETKLLHIVMDIFNNTALQVCEGQMMDMDFEKTNDVSVDQYIRMIGLKTSVLLAASMKIGAVIGGADTSVAEDLYNFGYNIGLAFQLQDDLLDSFGDRNIFGKMIGNDIITNKKTYLYLRSLEIASTKDKKQLMSIFSGKITDPEIKINQVMSIFNRINIQQHTQDIINHYFYKALSYLDKIPIEDTKKSVLKEFTQSLKNRKK